MSDIFNLICNGLTKIKIPDGPEIETDSPWIERAVAASIVVATGALAYKIIKDSGQNKNDHEIKSTLTSQELNDIIQEIEKPVQRNSDGLIY